MGTTRRQFFNGAAQLLSGAAVTASLAGCSSRRTHRPGNITLEFYK